MSIIENTTFTPWILGTLALLLSFALFVSFKSWRDMKQSPYFFMRQQAEKRLQTYSIVTTCLILVTALAGAYLLQPASSDNIARVAPIANAKPPTDEIRELVEAAPTTTIELITEEGVSLDELAASVLEDNDVLASADELLERILALPAEFDRVEPTASLLDTTEIGTVAFSTDINEEYQALNPEKIFAEGNYTIYATFAYEEMQDGMVWSWVWRRDGEVVSGGNEMWNYGDDGPGYVYYNPEEGFSNGEYTLEIWINRELFVQSDMIINTAAANANQ